ncbi:MAG: shikimate kinase [Coriobacteriales bacterium]|jgi:shikimate kinase|nr:shikimate kinase [Coriobacteriales bacterium]
MSEGGSVTPVNVRAARGGHLVFIGFMGAGKSTIARRLARQEGMVSIDMDAYIEREAGMPAAEIFASEGEEGFRARELGFLRSMAKRDRCILSCGGGVVTREASRELVRSLGTVVYLEVTADEALARISRPQTRPLLSGPVPPAELLEQRRALYEGMADVRFDTTGLTVRQVTQRLAALLKRRGLL